MDFFYSSLSVLGLVSLFRFAFPACDGVKLSGIPIFVEARRCKYEVQFCCANFGGSALVKLETLDATGTAVMLFDWASANNVCFGSTADVL